MIFFDALTVIQTFRQVSVGTRVFHSVFSARNLIVWVSMETLRRETRLNELEHLALKDCDSPPELLFLEGNTAGLNLLDSLSSRGLAIVGTRFPQPRTIQLVTDTVRRLAIASDQEVIPPPIIVSGFAQGIDKAAHEAALQFGLPTVAILGCGIDLRYPAHHYELKKRISTHAPGGLIVSEHEWKTKGYASQFLARNRLIAQWTRATWVVEAGIKSGAMNTAKWSRNRGRDCYSTPCFPGDPSLAGNELLIDLYQAIPFWGVHSLGSTWIELATLTPKDTEQRREIVRSPRGSRGFTEQRAGATTKNSQDLMNAILIREKSGSPPDIPGLLDWATARGWNPQAFYEALEALIEAPVIEERNGFLVTIESA